MFEDCGNCIAMEQSGYISEWQNLLLTLTSYNVTSAAECSSAGNLSLYALIYQNYEEKEHEKETIIRYHLHSGRLAAEERRTETASNLSEYHF